MLDLHWLGVLRRFSLCGSITATASSLGYSPSAISEQLSTLERETGVVLLERTARSATLPDAGWLLAEHAATLVAGAEQAESELAAQVRTIGGQRTISTVPSLATSVAVALAAVQQQHPVDVLMRQIDSVDAVRAVGTHLSDVAIVDE